MCRFVAFVKISRFVFIVININIFVLIFGEGDDSPPSAFSLTQQRNPLTINTNLPFKVSKLCCLNCVTLNNKFVCQLSLHNNNNLINNFVNTLF